MTPRKLAEERELRLLAEHFDRRNRQNAGDAAELKAALEDMAAKVSRQAAASVVDGRPLVDDERSPDDRDAAIETKREALRQEAIARYGALASQCGVGEIDICDPVSMNALGIAARAFEVSLGALSRRVIALEADKGR